MLGSLFHGPMHISEVCQVVLQRLGIGLGQLLLFEPAQSLLRENGAMRSTALLARQLIMDPVLDACLISHPQSAVPHQLTQPLSLWLDDIDLVQHALGSHLRQPTGIATVGLRKPGSHGARAGWIDDVRLMPLFLPPARKPPSGSAHLDEYICTCRNCLPVSLPLRRMQLQRAQTALLAPDPMTQCRIS